jgi:integrase
MRALRKLQREQEPESPFVFTSERGSPFTTAGFSRMERAAVEAQLGFPVHPHMLRHACGFALGRNLHGHLTHDAGKEIDQRAFVVVGNAHCRNYRSGPTR